MPAIGSGVRMPATTSSPWAFARNSPQTPGSPVGRIAREAHARAGALAAVAEDHLDDVHRRAEVVRDPVRAPVHLGARRLPRVEDGAHRALELHAWILRKVLARALAVQDEEACDETLEIVGGELDVLLHAAVGLQPVERVLEALAAEVGHDVAVHLNEPAVRVVREPLVPGRAGEALDRLVVQPEIQDRVHHPGHRDGRARAHRHEQRIVGITQPLAGALLERVRCFAISSASPAGNDFALRMYSTQAAVVIVKPAGTGIPSAVISARPAPFPPRSSRPTPALSEKS